MNDKNASAQKTQRIVAAWRELQAAIQSAPKAKLREIIAEDLELDLAQTKRALNCAVGRLITLARNGESAALQVLYSACCKMSKAVNNTVATRIDPEAPAPSQPSDLQVVRIELHDAIDDLIDLSQLGEPGALEELLSKGVSIASMLNNTKAPKSPKQTPTPTSNSASMSPADTGGEITEPNWRVRLHVAIRTLLKESGGKLEEILGKANSNLGASRFAIGKLSLSLPPYQTENPDIEILYELCDKLVEKRLNPSVERPTSVCNFLDDGWMEGIHPEPEPKPPKLVVPSKRAGSAAEFAVQVFEGIQQMQARSYPDAHLECFRREREKQAGVAVIKELKAAKTKALERGWVGTGEEWLQLQTPNMILEQLVALLPPLSHESVASWIEASIAYTFVWCNGNFEDHRWPESVHTTVGNTTGLPSAIRRTLTKGFNSLVKANP